MPPSLSSNGRPPIKGDGAALREARDNDPFGREARCSFVPNPRLEHPPGALEIRLIDRALEIESLDVVPGAHHRAAVDGDRPQGGVGENEAYPRFVRKPELGDDGLEVVAIGAEPMKPDDGSRRRTVGIDLDCGKEGFAHI